MVDQYSRWVRRQILKTGTRRPEVKIGSTYVFLFVPSRHNRGSYTQLDEAPLFIPVRWVKGEFWGINLLGIPGRLRKERMIEEIIRINAMDPRKREATFLQLFNQLSRNSFTRNAAKKYAWADIKSKMIEVQPADIDHLIKRVLNG